MEIITARLSDEVSTPELSRMWESQRSEMMTPEIVIESKGNEVSLRFHAGKADPGFRKLKGLFEQAVRRYRPEVQVEWLETPAAVR
jgi:hypothetical protein